VAAHEPIDLHHQGAERVIGSYVVETTDGLALFDCGPTSTLANLKRGLETRGLELTDFRHLLLSHIHLDHAGAAGMIAREHPSITVHVSEIGAPHLVDPSRLEASARRLYGDTFDSLWGELAPVPEQNVRVVGESVVGLASFPSPGHASHHVCYLADDGTLYAGDACGVRIRPHELVQPPTPPPDVDVDAWHATLDEIERRGPRRLALVHFGVFEDVTRHADDLRRRLHYWAELVAGGATEEEFAAAVRRDEPDPAYERAMPLWQSYAGLKRWADKVKPSRSRATGAA
jgi:glyoxylase-like metal-dependent hydrolase (beta-lactamase superfamily II)